MQDYKANLYFWVMHLARADIIHPGTKWLYNLGPSLSHSQDNSLEFIHEGRRVRL